MKISIIFSLFVGITSVLNAQDTLGVSAPDTLRFHKVISGHDAAVESLTFSNDGAFLQRVLGTVKHVCMRLIR